LFEIIEVSAFAIFLTGCAEIAEKDSVGENEAKRRRLPNI